MKATTICVPASPSRTVPCSSAPAPNFTASELSNFSHAATGLLQHMTPMKASPTSVGQNVRLALRFILFVFVGFWVMLYSTAALMARLDERDQHFISPFLSMPLIVIGALLMLYGVGEWRRWAYLWVFLSIPASLCLMVLILPWTGSKVLPVIVIAAAAFAIHARLRAHYAQRAPDQRQEDDHAGL